MAPGQDQRLEKLVDGALKSSNFQPLDLFLEEDLPEHTAIKCSKQFLFKVDKLVNLAIRKLNVVLDKIPDELKKEKKILSSQEASDVMTKLAGQVLDGGDYDFQIALMEALCRMANPAQRREMVHRWFSMDYVANAFITIRDSEFETLLMPSDEKLEEFWIDFNLGSQSLSFYFSLADEETKDGHWDTICITENEVQTYTIIEEAKHHVLRLQLSEVVCVGVLEGTCLSIHFSPSLDILHPVRAIYGHSKNKSFVGKSSTSVVKTTVKILMEDSCSQLITPARRRISESTTFISGSAGRSVHDASPYSVVLPANTPNKGKGKPALQMVHSYERQQGPFNLGELSTTARTASGSAGTEHRGKHAGHSIISSERSMEKVNGTQEEDQEPLEHSFVPDSQPVAKSRGSTFSKWHKQSVSDMLMMPIQRNKGLSRPESEACMGRQLDRPPSVERALVSGSDLISHKKLHSELSQRLQGIINQISLDSGSEESARPQREREPAVQGFCASSATTVAPPPRKADVPGSANRKRRGQGAPEREPAKETRATSKPIPARVLQDRTLNPKVKPAATVSGKEKRDAELADSIVKVISSRYDSNTSGISKIPSMDTHVVTSDKLPPSWVPPSFNRSIFERSWLPAAQKEASKAIGFNKYYSNPRKQSAENSSLLDPRSLSSTTKKGPLEPKGKRYIKKHLFSDTDTDQPRTDISWLRDSSRKPKPKVTDYTRKATKTAKTTARAPDTTDESPDVPLPSPKKDHVRPSKRPWVKEAAEQPDRQPTIPSRAALAAGRRPQRAVATNGKSYREPDTDDSQSEADQPPAPKAKSLQPPCYTSARTNHI
ncbi:Synaptonemal complex protein 2 [Merluccius polli]|uniref:Synaptonemal complex protein 2 n=1 Tax=Merluccius polli TaxID=89951 RepID=A0AA47M867_MERPO|nr:Synaptonemal complex protein 2 [Merluccius polli]